MPALSGEFGVSPTAWGTLLGAFLVGAGALQIPSGLLARRYGPRRVALAGAALLGGAALLSAAAPTFPLLVLGRFAAGAGAGLFFSPAIAVVGAVHPEGARGVPVGLFSSAFSFGAGLGVVGTALLLPVVGWRGSLAFGAVAMLLLWLVAEAGIPRETARTPGSAPRSLRLLRSPALWGIGLAFVGLEGASISAGQYFVPFAESVHGWSVALAGAVAAVFVFPSFAGGPVGGWFAERSDRRRLQMLLATAVPAVPLALLPFAGLGPTVGIALVFSFGYGMVYAMMYVLAHYLPEVPPSDVSLAIGLFNGIQLAGGAAVTQLVGAVIDAGGYALGWETLAALVIVPLVFLLAVPRTSGVEAPRTGAGA